MIFLAEVHTVITPEILFGAIGFTGVVTIFMIGRYIGKVNSQIESFSTMIKDHEERIHALELPRKKR